jgi:hypothetical protein
LEFFGFEDVGKSFEFGEMVRILVKILTRIKDFI